MLHKVHHALILRLYKGVPFRTDLMFGDGIRGQIVASSADKSSIFSNTNHIPQMWSMKSKGRYTLPCGTPKITFLCSVDHEKSQNIFESHYTQLNNI